MHPLRFPNNGIRGKGRSAMAWLPVRGGRLQPRPPCKGAARPPTRGGHPRAQLAAASPQGLSLADSPAASRCGGTGHKGGRPLARRLPTAKGSRRLRRGSDDDGAIRVKEG
ncbi:hypothetical protein BHE74_00039525 [Ensete ventricosum]|nr:hypothetical protein BHE74_00039525 [Ensete ventricosum]RZS05496.1 hypothetical protein BHM03_00036029 [Ensete ventricosum]